MKIQIDMQGVQTASRRRGIGRYTRAVTLEILKLGEGRHDIALCFNAALDGVDEVLDDLAQAGLSPSRRAYGPLRDTSSDKPGNDARRQAAERMFTHALDVGDADVVWLSSLVEGFASDALMPRDLPRQLTVATLYDLIPLHDPEQLGQSRARDWYMARVEALQSCDLLLAISDWVRADAIERLSVDPARIVNIGAGVDDIFQPPPAGTDHRDYLANQLGIDQPFILYNGGSDTRKNVERLFPAFASLPDALRERYQLVITGELDEAARARFDAAIREARLPSERVRFTGFVSDSDLVRLYQACALFVFPSAREGFGLPPLEAMACGAPVIVNDATSLPEVVGHRAALFDADSLSSLGGAMRRVLDDPGFAQSLRDAGRERAAQFTWTKVAERALVAMETAWQEHGQPRPVTMPAWQLIPPTGGALKDTQLPVYLADATHARHVLAQLRDWPGLVEWQGPLPPASSLTGYERYRAGGWAALTSPGLVDWNTLMTAEAIAVRTVSAHDDPAATRVDWVQSVAAHPMVRQRIVEDELATQVAPALCDIDLARIADAIDRVRPRPMQRWLVDVTHIAHSDLQTGIQRVVRNVLRHWLHSPPAGVRIEPIAFREGRYTHAHAYAASVLGIALPEGLSSDTIAISGNEVFVGLDWAMESLPSSAAVLRTWRRAGVAMHFVANDLLPVTHPEAFHPQTRKAFVHWLELVASLADAIHCISQSTADELGEWLRVQGGARIPAITVFPLGVEPLRAPHPGVLEADVTAAFASRPTLLMVGTIEPRKAHAQALAAIELLWASNADLNFAIVGKRGWLVSELIESLERHPERGKRLFWFEGCTDDTLDAVYEASTALLAPSLGEGFGLPVIEAAQRGKPVIARSLKVFREVAGDYPSYFEGTSPAALATFLARWLTDRPIHAPRRDWPDWKTSATVLASHIQRANRAPHQYPAEL